MYWSNGTRIPSIADTMSVGRFDKLKQYLHCNDNTEMLPRDNPNHDKLFKVRPVIDSVLEKCKLLPQEEKHSIDEQIIPTKCRTGLRQYLPKKPHKWGIKVWARCGVSGMVYDFQIYTGSGSGSEDDDPLLGVGGNVVRHLCSSLPKNVGHKVYFDNYFSSVHLLRHLEQARIWAVGTIRADRLKGAEKLLNNKKELSKKGRGSSDWCVDADTNITIVRWMDNGLVQLISNHVGNSMGTPAKRWSTKEKKHVEIPRPQIVEEYNEHMGGVDLCDMLMALYRIKLRSTKFYMHILYYCLNLSIVNGWLLYRRHASQKNVPGKAQMDLLKFQTQVATALLMVDKVRKPQRGRPSLTPPPKKKTKCHVIPTPIADVRYDGVGHMPDFSEKKQRCRHCPKGYSFIQCTKCQVHLCLVRGKNCFKDFHCK
ncbi:piggyBac transposable element-derived protein 3-like [Dendronephthya gigantea]|uniref:piggyBac transposable element-derived protein 3-like n=2 Tax=Dendronephthya gigantea TaxID=151771 RepID=UPI00106CAEB8|nr:piggyBac transposable element-derived protein 3-like [Dendronephthya gigantea]